MADLAPAAPFDWESDLWRDLTRLADEGKAIALSKEMTKLAARRTERG
jgi:hypothetical protein